MDRVVPWCGGKAIRRRMASAIETARPLAVSASDGALGYEYGDLTFREGVAGFCSRRLINICHLRRSRCLTEPRHASHWTNFRHLTNNCRLKSNFKFCHLTKGVLRCVAASSVLRVFAASDTRVIKTYCSIRLNAEKRGYTVNL